MALGFVAFCPFYRLCMVVKEHPAGDLKMLQYNAIPRKNYPLASGW